MAGGQVVFKTWWRWFVLALGIMVSFTGISILFAEEIDSVSLFVVAFVLLGFGGLGCWGGLRMGVRATESGIEVRPVVGPMWQVAWADIVGFTIVEGPSILPSKAPALLLAEDRDPNSLTSLAYYGWWGNTPRAVSRLRTLVEDMIEKRGDEQPSA